MVIIGFARLAGDNRENGAEVTWAEAPEVEIGELVAAEDVGSIATKRDLERCSAQDGDGRSIDFDLFGDGLCALDALGRCFGGLLLRIVVHMTRQRYDSRVRRNADMACVYARLPLQFGENGLLKLAIV